QVIETYVLYGLFAGVITFIAGVFPFYVNFKGIRYVIAISAGVVIATVFLDLLPETNLKKDAWIMALGFLLFYVTGKLTMLHSCGEMECEEHSMNMVSVIGMSLDNIIDGIAITVGYLTDPHIGLVITVAVVVHEIPQDLSATIIMRSLGYSTQKMLLPISFAAVSYPVGSYLAVFIPPAFHESIIAFVAGIFIYIGVGDLLAEAHRRFNLNVILSVLLGFVLVFILEMMVGH
ncbi:MAG: ZIP family metal transporter, partial [Deltaproteobacteria bacterium]|nr:ZIP family metal transporter [Deltaproteobacteria bacterium]